MIRIIVTLILFCVPLWTQNFNVTNPTTNKTMQKSSMNSDIPGSSAWLALHSKHQIPQQRSLVSFVVTSPKANIRWTKNQSYTIQWTKGVQPSNTVRIILSNPAGNALIHIIKDPGPNTGSFQWPIPESIPAGRYKILVRVSNTQISDMSDEFSIVEEMKAKPVDLSLRQVIVKKPQENRRYAPNASILIEWETKIQNYVLKSNNMLYFDIDIYDQNGANKIFTIEERVKYDKYYLGGDRYRLNWNWSPYAGNVAVKTGFYKIKITPKLADGPGGMPGFSGKFHISRGVEKFTKKLNPQIRNRFSRKVEYYTDGPEAVVWPVPLQVENRPGTARVGFYNYYDTANVGAGQYKYHGWIFRSQLTFPVDQYRTPGRLLLKAELRLTVVAHLGGKQRRALRNSTCAGALYYLTSVWSGKCTDTPGNAIAVIPDQSTLILDVTQYAQNWYTGSEPNHGFIIGSVSENFVLDKARCVTWYKAELILEFLQGNKD